MTAEVREIIARCFEDIGGYDAFAKWVKSSPKRRDAFYAPSYGSSCCRWTSAPKALTTWFYNSLEKLRTAFASRGVPMESIIKLKRLEEKKRKQLEAIIACSLLPLVELTGHRPTDQSSFLLRLDAP